MKRSLILGAALVALGGLSAVQAAEVLRITFDNAPLGTAPVPYAGYSGDTLGGASVNTSDPTGPSDPDLASAGAIVATPALAGSPQGGRALQVAGSNGYYIALPSGLSSYTIEAVIAFSTFPGGSAELGITNIFSDLPNFPSFNENWEVRSLGTLIGGDPPNSYYLMHDSSSAVPGDTNVLTSPAFQPVTNRWYDFALTYDAGTDSLRLYIDGVQRVSVNPGFGSDTVNDFTVAYWPNDANTNRDLVGYVDAIRVADTAETSFTLPAELSVFSAN